MTLTEKLDILICEKGLNQRQLSQQTNIPYSTISNWYNDPTKAANAKLGSLQKLSFYFGVSLDFLVDDNINDRNYGKLPSNVLPLPQMKKIPLIGAIACGTPILAQTNIEEYIFCPENIHADFCLRCQGDSMINARIFDGDIVFIRTQPDVENGEIAAVCIGEEATLKRVYKYSNKLVLNPENPSFEPLIYTNEELNDIKIIGKAVYFVSEVR